MEQKFNGGETNVYTHRLFMKLGKKFQTEVADQYEANRRVRGRVDAFVRLFERLLDTVSSSPKGEELVDACLASESGKLYVALAHASGRMEG